jgi:hypothetical protein
MSRGPGLVVAVLALLTAAIGLASSPIWGPHVCHAIGVCTSSDTVANNTTGGGNSNAGTGWTCPGGQFCGWDGPDGSGTMFVEENGSACTRYDIGSAGLGDRLTSYQNRTGKPVGLYNWTGQNWDRLAIVPDGAHDTLPASKDKQTDSILTCDK